MTMAKSINMGLQIPKRKAVNGAKCIIDKNILEAVINAVEMCKRCKSTKSTFALSSLGQQGLARTSKEVSMHGLFL